jgi:hypothetical protein
MQQLPAWAQLFPEFGQRDRIAQLLAQPGLRWRAAGVPPADGDQYSILLRMLGEKIDHGTPPGGTSAIVHPHCLVKTGPSNPQLAPCHSEQFLPLLIRIRARV